MRFFWLCMSVCSLALGINAIAELYVGPTKSFLEATVYWNAFTTCYLMTQDLERNE